MAETLSSGTPMYRSLVSTARRGVVVIPDIGGLRPLFTDLCDALAADHEWSVAAIEPWPGREQLSLDERLASVGTLDDRRMMDDVSEAGDSLDVEPVAVVGFCMGAMFALKAAAAGRVDRVVSFYGMVRLPDHWSTASVAEPLDVLGGAGVAPVLALVGTADPWVPASDADALEATGAEVIRYPGADHGFVHDPTRPTHRPDDAADAWRRVAAFLD